MSEENKQAQGLEEEVKSAQNEPENEKEAQNSLETESNTSTKAESETNLETEAIESNNESTDNTVDDKTSSADCNNSAEEEFICTSLSGITEDYVDPIQEEYFIERDNLIRCQWFLFYYMWQKKDTLTNMFLGC